jgi:hypothetical protein
MKFTLEQAIHENLTLMLIDSTIDTQADMDNAVDAIKAFDAMMLSVGVFSDTDHMYLIVNGQPIDYGQVTNEEELLKLLEVAA